MKACLLAFLAIPAAHVAAQDTPQYILGNARNFCLSLLEQDMNSDVASAGGRLSIDQICDCADTRMAEDPVVKKIAETPKELRRHLPHAARNSVYVTVKYYSASLACYAEAVGKSADSILSREK